MKPLVTSEVMAEIDRRTIEEIGIPGPVLMENAGRGTAAIIIETLEKKGLWIYGMPVTIVSGRGNNGGDGFVVARYLEEQGCHVHSYLVGKIEETQGDGRLNLDIFLKTGGEVREISNGEDLKKLARSIQDSEIVVDALFGTGLSKEISGIHRQVIDTINTYANMVCAIDIPSGVDAATGRILGEAVFADFTSTFGLMKVGQAVPPGCTYCGDLHVLDIGFPEIALDNLEVNNFLLSVEGVRNLLPSRQWDFHKGKAGKVYVIGGSTGLTGAVVMACEGALVAGSGLIYGVIPESLNVIFEQKLTEQMTLPVRDSVVGCFSQDMAERVLVLIQEADAVAIGPGLSHRAETEEFITALLPKIESPVVIDADGLNCLSRNPEILANVNAPVIVTPHERCDNRPQGIQNGYSRSGRNNLCKWHR
jgi:NAD(P)H-hydrate epimerase